MLKSFRVFESEVATTKSRTSIVDKIKSAIGEKVYVVPNFKQITREGEPLQDVTLCTLQSGHSFALNFDGNTLYSVDFWLPDSKRSIGTLYVADSGLSIDDVIKGLPALIKNPLEEVIEEKFKTTTKSKLVVKKAVEPKEIIHKDKGAKQVEKDIAKATKADEYENYKYGDKDTIFEDFRRYVRMVIKGVQPAFLCTGMPGVGKDFITKQELTKAGLVADKDWFKMTGKISAPSLFLLLYKYNGKMLVFSDCDSIFDKEDAVNVLKGALESEPEERKITWGVGSPIKDPDTGEKVPTRFLFTGKVIFLSNRSRATLKKVDAVKSRSFTLEVALSPKDMIAYVDEMLPKISPDKSMAIKRLAMNTIKSVSKVDDSIKLNMRTLLKAIVILEEVDDLSVAKRMIIQQCAD